MLLPRSAVVFVAAAAVSAATLALASCTPKKNQEPAPAGEAPSKAPSAAPAPGTPAAAPGAAATATEPPAGAEAAPIDRAAVDKLLAAWLAAQNAGDFAAYQGLYAEKMEGVKRVGPRTWRFDRKGWLADRERMFKRPMTVAARDVQVSGSAQTPTIELVQTFKQGTFSDEGPKRMVLTRGAAGLTIAREEMVRSVLAGALPASAGSTWLPVQIDGKAYVVLDEAADLAWATGGLRGPLPGDGGVLFAMREAGKAPAAWKARQLAVYSPTGERCPATVRALHVLGGGTPHFGEVQAWDGAEGTPPATQLQRARAVLHMAPPMLAGELAIEGACAPALVTDAELTAVIYRPAPAAGAAGALEAAALAAFRKLPGYLAIQREYAGTYDGKGAWSAQPKVQVMTDGTHRLVVVSAKEGTGCAEFYGALTAVFEEVGGKLELRSSDNQAYLAVQLVVDLEGDGVAELVGTPDDFSTLSTVLKRGASGYSPVRSLSFPFNDCGC